ncbi:MAG: hypothetical protein IH614_13635 [Desulfuromonadales bacterium]|nr:hypothetical protein [Desulfuromonadales bacterium]
MGEVIGSRLESCHDRVAVLLAAMRAGLTEDGHRGAIEILESVRADLEMLGGAE